MDVDTDGEYLSDSDSNEARHITRKKPHRYYTNLLHNIFVHSLISKMKCAYTLHCNRFYQNVKKTPILNQCSRLNTNYKKYYSIYYTQIFLIGDKGVVFF